MDNKYIAVIELGSSRIKGAVASIDPTGRVSLMAIEEEPLINAVRHGMIKNVESVGRAISTILRKLDNRIAPHKIRAVHVSLGGRSLCSTPSHVSNRFPTETEITDDILRRLLEEAGRTAMPGREIVAVSPCEFHIDGARADNPVGVPGTHVEADVTLLSCRPHLKNRITAVLVDRLQLEVADYSIRQLAEADVALSNEDKQLGCVFVDFGAETTTVSIYRGGCLRYLATLPLGSRNITRDLMSLNYMEEKAEEIKITASNAPTSEASPEQESINNYIAARTAEIIANIKEQIKLAGFTEADLPRGIVIVGGGKKLKGFVNKLSESCHMEVREGYPRDLHNLEIVDTRVKAADHIDIIGVMMDAASKAIDCAPTPVTEGVEVEPAPEPIVEKTPSKQTKPTEEKKTVEVQEQDTIKPKKKSGRSWIKAIGDKLFSEGDDFFDSDDDDE